MHTFNPGDRGLDFMIKIFCLSFFAMMTLLSGCSTTSWQANKNNSKIDDSSIVWNNVENFMQNWPLPKSRVDSITVGTFSDNNFNCISVNSCTRTKKATFVTIDGTKPLNGLLPSTDLAKDYFGPALFNGFYCTKTSLHCSGSGADFDVLCFLNKSATDYGRAAVDSFTFNKNDPEMSGAGYSVHGRFTTFKFDSTYNVFVPNGTNYVIDYRYAGASESTLQRKIRTIGPTERASATEIFQRAFKFFKNGDFERARILFLKGLDIDPTSAKGNYYEAESLVGLNNDVPLPPTNNPDGTVVLNNLVTDYSGLARYYYKQTVTLAPDSDEAALAQNKLQ